MPGGAFISIFINIMDLNGHSIFLKDSRLVLFPVYARSSFAETHLY